jgi:ABC-type lipoprotein export system ATPase subunit
MRCQKGISYPHNIRICRRADEGFNNLCVSLDAINEALESHYFEGKFVTAVGKTEWADIKWNDHSIAEKKTIINGADLVFTAAETVGDWEKARMALHEGGVNDRLLDCSDSHAFNDANQKDKLGNCSTWIKADTTFAGLLQVLNEPKDRTFVGQWPPKLVRVLANKTKYIRSLSIQRKASASLREIWFNNTIPLNWGLVAIIGNKGRGKSALTDTIGLLCNTKQHNDFTFLSEQNFRQRRDNKAKHFTSTLTWESESQLTKGLEEPVDERQPELVKYIPQNFLEKICTELGRIEESDFDRELKKVIFSHVLAADRLGRSSLDDLIAYKTAEADERIQILKRDLYTRRPAHRQKIENLLAVRRAELASHEKTKPTTVARPETDPVKQKEISEITSAIDAAKKQLVDAENRISQLHNEQTRLARLISTAEKLIMRLENLDREIQRFSAQSEADLANIGLSIDAIIHVSLKKEPLEDKRKLFFDQKSETEKQLDGTKLGTIAEKKAETETKIRQLQAKLDEPNKKYQEYEAALKAWKEREAGITGTAEQGGSIKGFESELGGLNDVPQQLRDAKRRRLAKTKEIYRVIQQLAGTYRELYGPIHQFIEKRTLTQQKFQLNFEVGIIDTGFGQVFFDIVSHGLAGTFCGVEEGRRFLNAVLLRHNFNTEEGMEAFLSEIMDAIETDKRPGGKSVRAADQIRKGKDVEALYDAVFSLDYLKPRYSLRMGDKELQQLSPGERGTLLLVFYLLIDKDDIPLVIDQPEENLDNQTVYELLVPCMKEAKERRQILMVTHNPNLAVVCDAEQIVCAELDKTANCKMSYVFGAIENPTINKAIVDVLEGTMPAFTNRDSKYFSRNRAERRGVWL